MEKIIGTFVFTNVGDGCLTSKYVNNVMDTPLVEGCKLISEGNYQDHFIGNFKTTWIENENESIFCNLNISNKTESIYNLKWSNIEKPNKIIFVGIGMIYQGNLVGSYWSL